MKYPLTFYWDKGVAKGSAASTRLCFVFIREDKRSDKGLYEHEMIHVKQWFVVSAAATALLYAIAPAFALFGLSIHSLLYMAYPRYRLAAEVQAYKEQLKYYKDDRTRQFAGFIADCYGLEIRRGEAEELLRQ